MFYKNINVTTLIIVNFMKTKTIGKMKMIGPIEQFKKEFSHENSQKKCEDDDSNALLNALQSKDPFDMISNSLFNKDYFNRIIVIDYEINEDCYIFAKMIEDWNREDYESEILQSKILKMANEDRDFKSLIDLFMNNDIDEENLEILNEKLKPFSREFNELNKGLHEIINFERKPIKIKFNSPGVLLCAYQTLSDVISLSKTKIIGINMGIAYSAAAFLLVSCHERLALEQSRFMFHKGSGGYYGSYEQTDAAQKNYKAEVDMMIALFKNKTNLTEKILNRKMNPDWFLSANDALNFKIIDRTIKDISEIL